MQLSQSRHLIPGFYLGWKATQLPLTYVTNPQEAGFLLAQFRSAHNSHLRVRSLFQLPCQLIEMEGRSELFRSKHLVVCEVREVVKDMCRYLQTQMEQFTETGQYLGRCSWKSLGILFSQLK